MSSVILLVDDNAIQATTRQAVLQQTGRRVVTASGGQAALDFLAGTEGYMVGLVITDHLMPGMNGPELVDKIRQRSGRVPIVVLSGLPDAESAYENLNVIFRLKPCPPDSLIAMVRELVRDVMPRSA